MQYVDFFVGSYTQVADHAPQACGDGIYCCRLNLADGMIEHRSTLTGVENPAYLALNEDQSQLFTLSENFTGLSSVHSYPLQPEPRMSPSHSLATHGIANCHLSLYSDRLFTSAYGSANVDVYRHRAGRLTHEALLSYSGSGPNTQRQQSSHPHQAQVSADGRWLYVCDLGADKVWRHALGGLLDDVGERGSAEALRSALYGPALATDLTPGTGPRHLVFHPQQALAYIACELTAQIIVCRYDAETGELAPIQTLNSLPHEFTGTPAAAAIKLHPNGRAVYISNRQHNSFSSYAIGEGGQLTLIRCLPSHGLEPRDLAVDPTGHFLLLANQDSNSLVVYRLDPVSGVPSVDPEQTFSCKTPVCVLFTDPLKQACGE